VQWSVQYYRVTCRSRERYGSRLTDAFVLSICAASQHRPLPVSALIASPCTLLGYIINIRVPSGLSRNGDIHVDGMRRGDYEGKTPSVAWLNTRTRLVGLKVQMEDNKSQRMHRFACMHKNGLTHSHQNNSFQFNRRPVFSIAILVFYIKHQPEILVGSLSTHEV